MEISIFQYINLEKTIDYQLFFCYYLIDNRGGTRDMKKNIKRLDNKGFTLVELLAVIVILALVMGIAASYMISTMNQSRQATLHNTAQNAAATLNSWMANDLLVTDNDERQLGTSFESDVKKDGTWKCLGTTDGAESFTIKAGGNNTGLLAALGLSKDDIKVEGTAPVKGDDGYGISVNTTCSAIRYNTTTGGYEILLVATDGGKFYVSDASNYAFSRANESGAEISD